MNTADFDFHLPEELIAQTPLEKRDASKLLIVNRETGEMQDKHFHSIIDMLEPGDALVMNDTRVLLPASMVKKWRQEVMWNFSSLRTLVETSGKFWLNLPNASRSVLVSALVMAASALSLQKN